MLSVESEHCAGIDHGAGSEREGERRGDGRIEWAGYLAAPGGAVQLDRAATQRRVDQPVPRDVGLRRLFGQQKMRRQIIFKAVFAQRLPGDRPPDVPVSAVRGEYADRQKAAVPFSVQPQNGLAAKGADRVEAHTDGNVLHGDRADRFTFVQYIKALQSKLLSQKRKAYSVINRIRWKEPHMNQESE